MTQRVEVDELFDFSWQPEENRVHYVRQVLSQGLHVITGLFLKCMSSPSAEIISVQFSSTLRRWKIVGDKSIPIVLRCLDQVIDFGVDQLEYSFFSCLLIASKFFRRTKYYVSTDRAG